MQPVDPGDPAISVIMPLHNSAASVRRAVQSVLDQPFGDFELIVVDDGSTDGSAELVEQIDDSRVRLVRLTENRGANAARNEGIRRSRGSIVCFLDSDDLYLPNKLETVAETFARRPELGGLLDSYEKVYNDRPGARKCRNPVLDDPSSVMQALFDRRIWKATSGISVRREAAFRAGLFDEALRRRQDFDFLVRLVRQAPVASLDTITWVKTSRPDSITRDLQSYMAGFTAFWDRHPDYYEDPALRRGFDADLAQHFGKLLRRRQFGLFARDLRTIRRRMSWEALARSLARGGRELRRLRRERRRSGYAARGSIG